MGPPEKRDYNLVNSAIDKKILPVIRSIGNLEETCNSKMMNMTSKMKIEFDWFYSVVSKLNSSLSNENGKIESKLGRLNATMEKITNGLGNLEKTCDAKIQNMTSKMIAEIDNLNSKLESSFEAKVQILKAELISRMESLPSSTNAPSLSPSATVPNVLLLLKQQGLCDVRYKNSCFWAIVHNNRDVNYTDAERLCEESGGQVADIYDNEHYDMVVKYLRTEIPSSKFWIAIWIGIKYNPIAGVATTHNGGQAYVSWNPGMPLSVSSWTAVFIAVLRNETINNQGMWNWGREWPSDGAVCEI